MRICQRIRYILRSGSVDYFNRYTNSSLKPLGKRRCTFKVKLWVSNYLTRTAWRKQSPRIAQFWQTGEEHNSGGELQNIHIDFALSKFLLKDLLHSFYSLNLVPSDCLLFLSTTNDLAGKDSLSTEVSDSDWFNWIVQSTFKTKMKLIWHHWPLGNKMPY